MSIAFAAELQGLLEGVALPADKQQLLGYARQEGAPDRLVQALRELPDREYRSLDEVGEALAPVQPRAEPEQKPPRAESGDPPGGEDYTRVATDTGQVRE